MVDVDKCKNWGTQEKTFKIHLQYYELQMFLLRKHDVGIGKKMQSDMDTLKSH